MPRGGGLMHEPRLLAGIVVTAYSPLAKARRMSDPKLLHIAAKYQRTAAQVRSARRLLDVCRQGDRGQH